MAFTRAERRVLKKVYPLIPLFKVFTSFDYTGAVTRLSRSCCGDKMSDRSRPGQSVRRSARGRPLLRPRPDRRARRSWGRGALLHRNHPPALEVCRIWGLLVIVTYLLESLIFNIQVCLRSSGLYLLAKGNPHHNSCSILSFIRWWKNHCERGSHKLDTCIEFQKVPKKYLNFQMKFA